MTTEDKAPLSFAQLLDKLIYRAHENGKQGIDYPPMDEITDVIYAHADKVQSAIEAERERLAAHIETHDWPLSVYTAVARSTRKEHGGELCKEIAKWVRARSTSQPNTKEDKKDDAR